MESLINKFANLFYSRGTDSNLPYLLKLLGYGWFALFLTISYFSFSVLGVILAIMGLAFSRLIVASQERSEYWFNVDLKKQNMRNAYGAKGWANDHDLINHGLKIIDDENPQPIAGINIGGNWYWNGKGHMLTVGGAGSGKGVSIILPALLDYALVYGGISTVVLDPKGENAAVSAPFLRSQGYDVHIINPFHIPQIAHLGNSRWNPFDLIEPHEVKKMCDTLAYSLHNRTSGGDSSFFDNKCRQYISLYMRYAYHTDNKNMNWVYKSLLLSGEKRQELLAKMAVDDSFSGAAEAENIISGLMGETAKTEENIFGTIQEAINILGDDSLRASMAASDFDMREISKNPTAIFLCIKHDELRYYAPWVRMFTDFLLKTLTTHYNPQRKVLVLLDEFAQLGYVNEFKNSPAILRGYNVTLWPIVQELGQLKSLYGDHWETFISNATIKQWLGGSMDNTTAKYIEERMPLDIKFVGNNADGSLREIQTKLMTAAEIMSSNSIIIEVAGLDKPIQFPKIPYYTDPVLSAQASPNPFY